MMEPVPWQLKIAFHFFGFAAFLMGLVQFGSTMASHDCVRKYTTVYTLNNYFFSSNPYFLFELFCLHALICFSLLQMQLYIFRIDYIIVIQF